MKTRTGIQIFKNVVRWQRFAPSMEEECSKQWLTRGGLPPPTILFIFMQKQQNKMFVKF